jgi:hypothetical protein
VAAGRAGCQTRSLAAGAWFQYPSHNGGEAAMPDIAIAKFSHEGNGFTPVATDLAAFR